MNQSQPTESRELTVLLSDLRGFTAIAEKFSPLQVINLLNRYFSQMSRIIVQYGGTIDKFMGDSIMALFGAPRSTTHDLANAIACAIEMQIAMTEINRSNSQEGLPTLYMGIGINTGVVLMGNLGSELHREYTVIGDQVNLASRVEAHCLRGQILLSENTFQAAQSFVKIGRVNSVKVKGKIRAVNMYELLATSQPVALEVPIQDFRKSPRIMIDAPLAFKRVSNKVVEEKEYTGRIIDISYGGLFATVPTKLNPLDEIKIQLSMSIMGRDSTDIYARVITVNTFENQYECKFEFTAIDDEAQAVIKDFVDHQIERL
ncbi:adenylate/guanylate cyclase domain-containing protein [Aliikangiella sp. GXAS 311]|uniref:Adenylate/guanylate cyclase domain-containing protein n=2 Tax=Aliikangiella maris TaxID=3162458 RepID=A0ABV2BR05_9GAMM